MDLLMSQWLDEAITRAINGTANAASFRTSRTFRHRSVAPFCLSSLIIADDSASSKGVLPVLSFGMKRAAA
jgi:hypothetical protein